MLKPEQQISRQLAQAGRKLQRFEGRLLWLRGIPALLFIIAIVLGLDLAFQFGSGIRLLLLLLLVALAIGYSIRAMWISFGRIANPRRVARHLESRDPSLGSSLINFLDLADTADNAKLPKLTREMATAAQQSHASDASQHDLPRLVHNNKLRPAFKFCSLFILSTLIISFFAWPVIRAHVPRLLLPFSDYPPYSMTTLTFLEPSIHAEPIVFGSPIRIAVTVKGHHPRQVDLVYWPTERPQETYRLSMIDRSVDGFVQQIAKVEEALTIMAETPDGRSRTRPLELKVHLTPKIEKVTVEITPPSYTGLPTTKRNYNFNELRALTGSTISLSATSNRPLASGEITLERPLDAEPLSAVLMLPIDETTVRGAFTVTQSAGFSFTLTDHSELCSDPSPRGSISALQDRPPSVSITSPGAATLLALDAAVDVIIEAHDDYGLKELRIHRAINGIFSAPKTIQPDSAERRMQHTWTLDFATIGIQAEDVVTLYAETIDNAPEPQVARTEMIRIAAVSIENYNSLLREQVDMTRIAKKYAALMEQFDTLMQEQAEIQKQLQQLQEALTSTTDPAERKELMQAFDALMRRQDQLNDSLEQLAHNLESSVRENPLYDVESAYQKRFKQEADSLRQAAKANQSSNQQIADKLAQEGLSPEQANELMEQFEQALQAQREQLMGAEKEVAEANETMEDMADFHEMAKNFNRFTSLANQQRTLAEQTKAFDQPGRLSREDQLALRDLASDQKAIADELKLLVDKFRNDAEIARDRFPQAAASSREFADAIELSRAPKLSNNATDSMLDGDGRNSASLATATSDAMEALISQCNGSMSQMGSELDQALSAKRPGGAGNTFQQMMDNMKMRYAPGSGSIGQSGRGSAGGSSSYSTSGGEGPSLLGNESLAAEGDSSEAINAQSGGNDGPSDSSQVINASGAPGTLSEMQEQHRQSESVRAESLFIEHDSIVDAYFKKITEAPADSE